MWKDIRGERLKYGSISVLLNAPPDFDMLAFATGWHTAMSDTGIAGARITVYTRSYFSTSRLFPSNGKWDRTALLRPR